MHFGTPLCMLASSIPRIFYHFYFYLVYSLNMYIIWAELGWFETMGSFCVKLFRSYNHPPKSPPVGIVLVFPPAPTPPKVALSSLVAGANLEWHGERVQ